MDNILKYIVLHVYRFRIKLVKKIVVCVFRIMQIQILTFILTTETSLKIASHAFQVEVLGPHVVIMLITKHKV